MALIKEFTNYDEQEVIYPVTVAQAVYVDGTKTVSQALTEQSTMSEAAYVKKIGDTMSGTLQIVNTANDTAGIASLLESQSYKFGLHVGTGGTNHGLYDWKTQTWILLGNAQHSWTFNGNATSATTAGALSHKSLTSTTIGNTSGTFAFSGSGAPWAGSDWVGLQVGDSKDKFQISQHGSAIIWRFNDSGGTNTADWSDWKTLVDSSNVSTGDANGQIKIAGTDIPVKGLAALAYKDSLTASEVGAEPTISLTASRALVSNSSGKVAVSQVTSTELGYLSGVTSAVQTQLNGKQASITGAATTITSSNLTASRALISNSSGKVAVSAATSTELGYLSGVTSAIQTQLNGKQAQITGGATSITDSNLTASRTLVSDSSGKVAVSSVTSTELGYLSGVTSAVQTQLNGKQAQITGGATTITSSNLTASRALVSNASGKVAVSDVTSTELGYLDGVTQAIQTQIDGKSPKAGSTSITTLSDTVTFGDTGFRIVTSTIPQAQHRAIGWYRIAQIGANAAGTIYHRGGYNTGWPTSAVVAFTTSHTVASMMQLAGRKKSIFTKYRLIRDAGEGVYYIDAYQAQDYSSGTMGTQYFTIVGSTPITALNPTEPTDDETSPITQIEIVDMGNGYGYLPLSGGTLTGTLTAKSDQYTDSYSGALNMANSNIYGVNAIYTADAADGAAEGINFYRDATHVDTLWMNGGDLLFVPNRVLGTNTTKANSQKVGRFTANPTTGQVVVTDGTTGGIKTTGYTIATSVPANAVFTDTTYQDATASTSGLMSSTDKQKLDNLQVGARNLVLSSEAEKTAKNALITFSLSDYGKTVLTTGTKFTASFDVKVDNASNTKFDVYLRNSSTNVSDISPRFENLSTEYERRSFTGTVSASGALTFAVRATSAGGNGNTSATLTFRRVQVELGTEATDWTPAYEDVRAIAYGGTGASTALAAITNLGGYSHLSAAQGATAIPANANLNTYRTPGTYYSENSTRTNTLTNVPITQSGFKLYVEGNYSTSYILQVITCAQTSIYYRVSTSTSAWGAWRKILSSAHGTAIGSSTRPVYITDAGEPAQIDHTIQSDVPSGAVFTDTTYTFASGTSNGAFTVTPAGGNAQSVQIYGLGSAAYTNTGDYSASGHVHDVATQSANGFMSSSDKKVVDNAAYDWSLPSVNGANSGYYLRIKINSKAAWMLSFGVSIYSSYQQHELQISGYNYSTTKTWYSPNATLISSTQLTSIDVIFAKDGDNDLSVYVPLSGNYGHAIVHDAVCGYSASLSADMFTLTRVAANTVPTANITTVTAKHMIQPASSAPGGIASSGSTGTSSYYARQDHTHGIALATGDANGQVKIAGTNVDVKGLGALAYKDSLGKSDVGLGNVDNKSSATIRGEITSSNVTTALGYTPVNKAGDTMSGVLTISRSTSGDTGITTTRTDQGMSSAFFGVGSGGINHGIYSNTLGKWMVYADASKVYLNGNATTATTADALKNFTVTTTTNMGIDTTTAGSAVGYVSGLTRSDWNYNQVDGALYRHAYNSSWIHQIYGDYRTGQLSVRARNSGTWQEWRRILDESNYSSIISLSGLGLDNVDNTADADKIVASAGKLTTAYPIDGVNFDGTTGIIHYGECSTVAGTAEKAVPCTGFVLATGAWIAVRFTVTNTAAVANLKLNVNETGGKGIKYRNANLPAVGDLAAGRTYLFVYDGTYWQWVGDRDTNSNTYDREYVNGAIKAKTAITAGFLTCGDASGYQNLAKGAVFDISYPVMYQGTAITANQTRTDFYSSIPMNCTATNGGTSPAFTAYKAVYIKGKLIGSTFTVDSSTLFTQTVPASADNNQYYFLGIAYSATNIKLMSDHPIFEYKNGAFQLCARDAATVNGHTVATDVPSDAVFTDTTALGSMTGTLGIDHGGTGKTTALAAANNLSLPFLGETNLIANGTDLNTIVTPGTYAITSTVNANTMSNIPVAGCWGVLTVYLTDGKTAGWEGQSMVSGATGKRYYRYRKGSDAAGWSDWVTYDDEATASVAGLMPAADKQKLDDLEVGGRNLVLNSADTITIKNTYNTSKYLLTDYGKEAIVGKTVTISFEVMADNITNHKFEVYLRSTTASSGGTNGTALYRLSVPQTSYTRMSVTAPIITDVAQVAICFRNNSAAGNGNTSATLSIRRVKLEIGTTATDWTKAPEEGLTDAERARIASANLQWGRSYSSTSNYLKIVINSTAVSYGIQFTVNTNTQNGARNYSTRVNGYINADHQWVTPSATLLSTTYSLTRVVRFAIEEDTRPAVYIHVGGTYGAVSITDVVNARTDIAIGPESFILSRVADTALPSDEECLSVTAGPSLHLLGVNGGTMQGPITLQQNQYNTASTPAWGLDANNSDIVKLNSIYTANASADAREGIHFYRSSTTWDTLWMKDGVLLFAPNRGRTDATTAANSQKVGRFTSTPTTGRVVVTDGATGGMTSSAYTIEKSVPSDAVFTDTTYSFSPGTSNGTIKVTPAGGTAQDISVTGLGQAAYTASTDYAASGHNHNSAYVAKGGDTMTGTLTVDGGSTVTRIWAGSGTSTAVHSAGAHSNSGNIYLASVGNSSGNGARGLYIDAHGTGAGKTIIQVDTNNNVAFTGSLTGLASDNVPKSGGTMTGQLKLQPASGEGGEILLAASAANQGQTGIYLDQYNSLLRIYGCGAANGQVTGAGAIMTYDPYSDSNGTLKIANARVMTSAMFVLSGTTLTITIPTS